MSLITRPEIRPVDANGDEANTIRDSTSWKEPRSTDNLPAFLEAFAGENEKLDQAPKKCGSPHTIIVAGAGLRAANLVRYDQAVGELPRDVGRRVFQRTNNHLQSRQEIPREKLLCGQVGKQPRACWIEGHDEC